MLPVVAILQVVLHLISLPLEIQIVIGPHPVAALRIAPQPFYDVPQRKPHEQHLALLQGVDVFVVLVYLAQPSLVAPAEDDAEDVRGQETAKREVPVIDDLHAPSVNLTAKVRISEQITKFYVIFLTLSLSLPPFLHFLRYYDGILKFFCTFA